MSTTVSNPYSFNIKNNTDFSSQTITPDLPDKETLLIFMYGKPYYEDKSITMPLGCKVVKLEFCLEGASEDDADSAEATVYNISNNKSWGYVDMPNIYGYTKIVYVGITPGKTYTLRIHNDGNNLSIVGRIYYSKSINNMTPDITDY